MEAKLIDARPVPDYVLNEALDAHAVDELDGLSIQNQRLAKIQEYEEASLLRTDPFAAVLGMGNASMQRIFEHLGAAILEELDGRPHTVEEFRELAPEIRLLAILRRSIETEFVVQRSDATQQAAAFNGMKGNGFGWLCRNLGVDS
jgi:hypothetical protein